MGKSKKHKKEHKKEHKKKKHRSRSPTRDSSSSRSSSTSESDNERLTSSRYQVSATPKLKSATETLNDLFKKNSNANWHLSQKSEQLMFDQTKEVDDKQTETFVWRKKNQKIGLDKLEPEKVLLLNKFKQEETSRELEKLKKRKIEREREREEREREREFLQRQKETEYHKEWEKQEDSFHLKQVKLRSKIRIEEGRAKPIDLLAKYINAEDDDLAIEMHEPYTYLNGLTIRDLEDLLADIKIYSDLELGINADYWRDITIVTEDELKKLQKLDKHSREHAGDRREGINQSVLQDVGSLFKGKTYDQLLKLEESIKKKISDESGIDIGYWESLLSQLKAHMARARLRDRHKEVLYKKLNSLKKEQGIHNKSSSSSSSHRAQPTDSYEHKINERIRKEEESYRAASKTSTYEQDEEIDVREEEIVRKEMIVKPKTSSKKLNPDEIDLDDDDENEGEEDEFDKKEKEDELNETNKIDQITKSISEYQLGNYSPILLNQDDLPFDTYIITQEEDNKKLEFKRNQVIGTGSVKPDLDEEFEMKARDTMGGIVPINEIESEFETVTTNISKEEASGGASGAGKSNTIEIPVEHHYLWSDKYRPRKPRYYNRVHTGYDWNQYNKKHYDVDNPPPKTVQGYKFNIFYPDMIDKTKTPRYSITVCKDNKDFSILRFHAGAPYEDVAFKIVNREWDISHKHGFRNHFQNGMYQLWFHFRKWKYRR